MRVPPRAVRPTRVAIADDHRLFRDTLHAFLDAEPDLEVVAEASNGIEAVEVTRRFVPDILLLDVAMPQMDGIDALREIAGTSTTRIILLTAGIDQPTLVTALQLGAGGIVLKQSGAELLLRAVRSVRDGALWVEREAVGSLAEVLRRTAAPAAAARPSAFGLTGREQQIVAAVVAAQGNREIAERLAISEKTVKHHLTNIFDKLGVSNRLELALFAIHNHLTGGRER